MNENIQNIDTNNTANIHQSISQGSQIHDK
jgi:hypothetical protein